jgi:site-specific DNA recombinase
VRRLKEEADRLGLRTKCSTTTNGTERGGKPFSRGHLYTLLANPIYTGHMAHKGELHPGQQAALIDDESWSTGAPFCRSEVELFRAAIRRRNISHAAGASSLRTGGAVSMGDKSPNTG